MLRPISSDSLGAGERCAGETHWIRSSENTSEHTQLLAFHLLEIHLSCILQLSCTQKVSCIFSGTSLIKLSYSQPRIFPLETGSYIAQPGLELATDEDDFELIFHLPIAGHFRLATIPSSPLTTCQ